MSHTMPPRSAAARGPVPVAGHCWPVPLQENTQTLKGRSGYLLWGSLLLSLGPGAHKVVCALQASLAGLRFDSKCDFALSTILSGPLLCPWMRRLFFFFLWDTTFSCQWLFTAASYDFHVLTREDEHTSFYSTILKKFISSESKQWCARAGSY